MYARVRARLRPGASRGRAEKTERKRKGKVNNGSPRTSNGATGKGSAPDRKKTDGPRVNNAKRAASKKGESETTMAKRYSGQVTVRIIYRDATWKDVGHYDAVVSWPGGHERVSVGEPRILTHAVDSPEAYDGAARAAISFSRCDGDVAEWAADGSALIVHRSK